MAELQSGENIVLISETINPDKGYIVHRDGLTEFRWDKVVENEEAGMAIIHDAIIYPGIHSYEYVRYRDLMYMVDDDYRPKVEDMVFNHMMMFTKLNKVDQVISDIISHLTFGHFYLSGPLFTPVQIYIAPGFYDIGFYTEWDEVAIPMEDWRSVKRENDEVDVEVERISMFHHNRNLEKKRLSVFEEEQGEN